VRVTERGFTLLEVLVALVIVGLGMIAVFSQVSQALTATARLRDKTLATWVGTDRITELRLAGEFPDVGDRSDEIEMAGVRWSYRIKTTDVGVEDFRRVDVTVAFADEPDRQLVEVSGFLRRLDGPPVASAAQFAPRDPNADISDGQLR
jgi:general secretion pathway protein I